MADQPELPVGGPRLVRPNDPHFLRQVQEGNIGIPKSNWRAEAAPGVNDDISLGYRPGSLWFDTVAGDLSVCADNTRGAAAWTLVETGGAGAPNDADYLVGTANAGLTAEIVVGTTPGGELGGTWASPTVDSVHSGSAHHSAVTLSGAPDYITLSGQDIVRGLIDLAADVAGLLPEANIDPLIARDSELHAQLHGPVHAENAGDEILVENLGTGPGPAGRYPRSSGAGGLGMAQVAHSELSFVTSDLHHAGFIGLEDNAAAAITPAADDRIQVTDDGVINADASGNTLALSIAQGQIDHGTIGGLGDDDHTQYALLAGRSGGQVITGGLLVGDTLTLRGAPFGVDGQVILGTAGRFILDEPTGQLRLPVVSPSAGLLLGGDAQWYRSAADEMRTPDDVVLDKHLAVGATSSIDSRRIVAVSETFTNSADSATENAGRFNITVAGTGATRTVFGLTGTILSQLISKPTLLAGFQYGITLQGSAGATSMEAGRFLLAAVSASGTVDDLYMVKLIADTYAASTVVATNFYGIHIPDLTAAGWVPTSSQTAYGIQINAFDAETNPTRWPFYYGDVGSGLFTVNHAGQLAISTSGITGGIILGDDVQLYRGAANRLDLGSGDSLRLVDGSISLTGTTGGLGENTTAQGMKLAAWGTSTGIGIQTSLMEFIAGAVGTDYRWGYGASGALTEIMFLDSGTGTLSIDIINELTNGMGVTVESVLIENGLVDGIDVAARDHNEAHGIAAHTGHANWKALYTDGSGDEQELALGANATVLAATGVGSAPGFEEIYTTHIAQFPALAEDLVTGVMGALPGLNVGESGEHGTFTAIRAKAIAGTAGTGTTTILVEADDNPAFTSAVTLFTLALNTATEVDDTTLDTAWAAGDIFVRARCTAVGATAPKDVNVLFYFKERVENF